MMQGSNFPARRQAVSATRDVLFRIPNLCELLYFTLLHFTHCQENFMRLLKPVFLFLLCALFTTALSQAQLRFTRADAEPMMQNGTMTVFDATDAPGKTFNLGSKGSGNTWDFSVYQYTSDDYDRVFVSPSLTPYGDMFESATHAQQFDAGSESYSYFLLNDAGLYSLGVATEVQSFPYILAYAPPKPEFLFPLQLGSTWNYKGDPVVPIEGMTQETESSVEAISSGTLVTPLGSFEALCVKNVTKLTVRFAIGGQVISEGYTTSTDYMFMTKSGVTASLSVDSADSDSMTPLIEEASVSVEGNVNRIDDFASARPFALQAAWPNPAQSGSALNVGWTQERGANVRITLHDMLGRELRTVFDGYAPTGAHALTVPTNDLPAGLYMLRGHSAGMQSGMQRIMVVH
jgi:hypothetical protein